MFTSNDLFFLLFSIYDLTFTDGMEMKLAFSYSADPDDPITNEETTELSDDEDDDDYNPGGYEAVYCFEDEWFAYLFLVHVTTGDRLNK